MLLNDLKRLGLLFKCNRDATKFGLLSKMLGCFGLVDANSN
jgi:hypothetical protein